MGMLKSIAFYTITPAGGATRSQIIFFLQFSPFLPVLCDLFQRVSIHTPSIQEKHFQIHFCVGTICFISVNFLIGTATISRLVTKHLINRQLF